MTARCPNCAPGYDCESGIYTPQATPHSEGGVITPVYVVMLCDRHADPEPAVFTTEAAALDRAREIAADWLVEDEPPAGWLYYAEHPTEDDAVWVVACTLDEPSAVSA